MTAQKRKLRHCVNGERRESASRKYMPITDSSTGEVTAEARGDVINAIEGIELATAVPVTMQGIPFGWMIPVRITAGNTFVLKANSQTPRRSMRILELAHEAELLLKDPDVRGISYVGSTSVGRHIYQTAAAHGKRVQALRPGQGTPLAGPAPQEVLPRVGLAGDRARGGLEA